MEMELTCEVSSETAWCANGTVDLVQSFSFGTQASGQKKTD